MASMSSPPLYREYEDKAVINARQRERYSKTLRDVLKQRRLDHKLDFIQRLGGKCERCGFQGHHSAIHFDHIDRTTKAFEPGRVLDWPDREKAWGEVSKCRLLCANCHAIHTFENGHTGGTKKYVRRKEWVIICKLCGTEVRTKSPRTLYCGSTCKRRARG